MRLKKRVSYKPKAVWSIFLNSQTVHYSKAQNESFFLVTRVIRFNESKLSSFIDSKLFAYFKLYIDQKNNMTVKKNQ